MANDITKRVVAFAESLGFAAEFTRGGHLKFSRPGVPAVFFSKTPSDHRACQNGFAKLRKAVRGAA